MNGDRLETLVRTHAIATVLLVVLGLDGNLRAQENGGSLPASTYEGTETSVGVLGRLDLSCIFRNHFILGAMVCTHGFEVRACLIHQNPYPVGILESVRRKGTSFLSEAKPFLSVLKGLPVLGDTSSHTNEPSSGTGLQFSEAHAYESVPDLPVDDFIAKPSGSIFVPRYFSEADGFFWRSPEAARAVDPSAMVAGLLACSKIPRPAECAGTWGPWYPETGFLVHPSEVMAAHVQALRGARVSSHSQIRVSNRYQWEPRTGHFVQMVRPIWKTCVSIGSPLVKYAELGAGSTEGAYLFIHFAVFIECNGCLPAILQAPLPPTV
jgi:hypothetical protein